MTCPPRSDSAPPCQSPENSSWDVPRFRCPLELENCRAQEGAGHAGSCLDHSPGPDEPPILPRPYCKVTGKPEKAYISSSGHPRRPIVGGGGSRRPSSPAGPRSSGGLVRWFSNSKTAGEGGSDRAGSNLGHDVVGSWSKPETGGQADLPPLDRNGFWRERRPRPCPVGGGGECRESAPLDPTQLRHANLLNIRYGMFLAFDVLSSWKTGERAPLDPTQLRHANLLKIRHGMFLAFDVPSSWKTAGRGRGPATQAVVSIIHRALTSHRFCPGLTARLQREVLTHPERLILTHLVLQDSRSGQGRQFRFTPPFGSSSTSSTRESGSSRRSSRRSGNDASGGPKAPRSSARPGRSGSTR